MQHHHIVHRSVSNIHKSPQMKFISCNKPHHIVHRSVSSIHNIPPLASSSSSSPLTKQHIATRCFASSPLHSTKNDDDTNKSLYQPEFKSGDLVMVEVIYFGPLGASVDVVAHNTHDPSDCIPQDEAALGRGMILQSDIAYFRKARGMVDIVKFEILPAYVERVIEKEFEDGVLEERLDISLRPPGGKRKAQDMGEQILERLKESGSGELNIGDKSSPEEINEVFPGCSKGVFKKAVSALYKRGLITPGKTSISLM